jgi:hypothetical protein
MRGLFMYGIWLYSRSNKQIRCWWWGRLLLPQQRLVSPVQGVKFCRIRLRLRLRLRLPLCLFVVSNRRDRFVCVFRRFLRAAQPSLIIDSEKLR